MSPLLLFVVVMLRATVLVHGQQPAFFQAQVHRLLKSISDAAVENHRSRSVGVESCKSSMNCHNYRLACQSLKLRDSQCATLPRGNIIFTTPCDNSSGHFCSSAAVYNGSYVWLPWWNEPDQHFTDLEKTLSTSVDTMTCDQFLTICSQMQLDKVFREIYHELNDQDSLEKGCLVHVRVIQWHVPDFSRIGIEAEFLRCQIRPKKASLVSMQYKTFTHERKQITVLLDTGNTMGDQAYSLGSSGISTLQASQRIVTNFLDTLNKDDEVFLYSFNQSGISAIGEGFTVAEENTTALGEFLQPWKDKILSLQHDSTREADLTKALEAVIQEQYSSSNNERPFKILLIIAGQEVEVMSFENSSIAVALDSNQVRTFIAQWEQFIPTSSEFTNLSSYACSLRASYTVIDRGYIASDYLSPLQSYYSYLANVRFRAVGKKPIAISSYASISGIGDVISVAYPAFDDNDDLIGVASIDIPTTSAVKTLLANLIKGPSWTVDITVTNPSCTPRRSYKPLTNEASCKPTEMRCDQSVIAVPEQERQWPAYDARVCCDPKCSNSTSRAPPPEPPVSPPPPPPPGGGSEPELAVIVAPVAIGTVMLVALILLGLYWRSIVRAFRERAHSDGNSAASTPRSESPIGSPRMEPRRA